MKRTNNSKIRRVPVAVVGASGYSGEELLHLLVRHPRVRLSCLTSRQYAGEPVTEVFPRFAGQLEGVFTEPTVANIAQVAEVAFLALPHGVAAEFAVPLLKKGVKIIDLSADFRTRDPVGYEEFYGRKHPAPQLLKVAVYGLPERHRGAIQKAQLIAVPGCYPTSIILAAAPALAQGLINPGTLVATSLSGVSGAGRKVETDYLFVECNESARAYGVPKHRHLGEIEQELSRAAGKRVTLSFAPHLIPLNRGIATTIVAKLAKRINDGAATEFYRDFYAKEPFIRVLADRLPDTKHVERTNFCDLAVRVDGRTGRLFMLSAIDNLTKGAAGQAVQCFNLLCGFEETEGLP